MIRRDPPCRLANIVIPRARGIQHATASPFEHWRLGVLDRPLSRAMTTEREQGGRIGNSETAISIGMLLRSQSKGIPIVPALDCRLGLRVENVKPGRAHGNAQDRKSVV